VTGARRAVVLTEDVAEDGTSKRPFPSPGDDGVYRIITKMAVFDVTPAGPELAPSPRTRHRPASHQFQRPIQGQQTPSSPLPGGDMSESPEAPAVQQRGPWFEKLHSRVVEQHSPGATLSEADSTQFSTMTRTPHSLHLDAAFTVSTEFGERLVNTLLTMSVLVGLCVGHLTQDTIVANLGFRDACFRAQCGTATRSTGRRP
jgi:hypothetical protein